MKTSMTTAAEDEALVVSPILLTESEVDNVSGGAPPNDVGKAWGGGQGSGFDGRGGGKGRGWFMNNEEHGRF